jgi:hypothetical protein
MFSSASNYVVCKVMPNTEGKENYSPRDFFLHILQFACFSLPEQSHSLFRFYCSIEQNVYQVLQEGRNPKNDYITLPFSTSQ